MGRSWRPLTRCTATRVVGLAALGGFAALGGLATFGTDAASGAGSSHPASNGVTTSVSFTLNLRVKVPNQDAAGWQASGEADFTTHTAQESVTLPLPGLHALDVGKTGLLPGDKDLVLGAKWIGGSMYITVPSTLSGLAGGAPVLSLPISAAEVGQVDVALDRSAVALTYAKVLLNDLAGHGAQRRAGTRTIDGVKVTGTRVGLTLDQLLKVSPGLSPAMIGDLSMFGNDIIPVTVWIDAKGRLKELTMSLTGKGSAPSISGTVEFSDYNAPVTITAPPASSVKPVGPALQKLLSSLNLFDGMPLP
jgi:hypothetical protein